MDSSRHWIIKNSEGQLLKYLHKDRAVFCKPNDKSFRVYTFAKMSTVEKTLEKLKNFGLENCEAIEVENQDAHDKFDIVQQHQDEVRVKNLEVFNQQILAGREDYWDEKVHDYCKACSRGCKVDATISFFGPCPQYSYRHAS